MKKVFKLKQAETPRKVLEDYATCAVHNDCLGAENQDEVWEATLLGALGLKRSRSQTLTGSSRTGGAAAEFSAQSTGWKQAGHFPCFGKILPKDE